MSIRASRWARAALRGEAAAECSRLDRMEERAPRSTKLSERLTAISSACRRKNYPALREIVDLHLIAVGYAAGRGQELAPAYETEVERIATYGERICELKVYA